MAKSQDKRFSLAERSVAGHSMRVARAAICLITELADDLARTFGLSPEARELFDRVCVLASALHDIGKSSKSFQDMLHLGNRGKHPFRHELLSAALISGPGPLRQWLESKIEATELELVAMAAAGHHLRADLKMQNARVPRGEILYLDHPSLAPLWQFLGEHLGVESLPSLALSSLSDEDIEDILHGLIRKEDGVKVAFGALSAHVLPVAKAIVICADIIGSGRPENERDMDDWASEVLNFRLTAVELQPLINKRLGGQRPYTFQERVRDSLEQITLVTAGCGNGKTLAAYLWAQRHAQDRKLIFCYPTTGTTTAGFADYLLAQSDLERALMHSRARTDIEAFQDVPDESGEEPLDPLSIWARDAVDAWSKKVIACTVDTVLSFLAHWRKSLAMMPVWSQSVFVFDEIHSYDRDLFGALLAFVRVVRAPILLMTASLTQARLQALNGAIGRNLEPITGSPNIEEAKRYTVHLSEPDWAREQVISELRQGAKVLWVSNTVGRAIKTFKSLRGSLPDVPVWLYHSRFRYRDRVERQRDVLQAFDGPGPALVIATQVCEMSLDISADLLVTELAPFPALVQRLGRLNRKDKIPTKLRRCLVIEPERVTPYEADELNQTRAQLAALGSNALSQRDLAIAIASVDEKPYEPVDMPFLTQWAHTFPGALRQRSYTITLVRQEDLDTLPNPKRPQRAELVNLELSMLPYGYHGTAIKTWRRTRGIPIAPRGTVEYSLACGATWAK